MNNLSKKYKYILFLVFLSIYSQVWANENQYGGQFLTHIKYQNSINNYVWSIAQSTRNTIIVASRTGVMEYNSEEWNAIKTPDIALSLLSSKLNDRIYTCGRNHIGYLEQNEFGQYAYLPINENNSKGIFTDIFETDSGVYFYSSHKLLHYNLMDSSISTLKEIDSSSIFLGSFVHANKLYLNVRNKGVFLVHNTTLTKVREFKDLLNLPIAFSCKFDTLSTLIGTQNGKLFLLNSKGITPYIIEDKEYLQKGTISDGLIYSDSKIAISFKNLGLIIIDKNTGKTTDIIDSESGLPDDFVMTLFADKNQALWIAHSLGLSRIDASLPIKKYSSYFGIEGSIITSNFWNKKLYVATSEGVFVLDSISKYETREAYKKIPIVNYTPSDNISDIIFSDNSNQVEETNEKKNIEIEEQKKKRRGLFKRLFSTKKEPNTLKSEAPIPKPAPIKSTKKPQKQRYEYFYYQQYILKSKQFGFSHLGELKERCSKLISLNDQLLALTNSELYSIDSNSNVTAIFSGTNILDIVLSKTNDKKVYIIDNEGIYTGIREGDIWNFTLKTERDTNFNITSLVEISEQSLLVSLNNQLVKVDIEKGEITDIPLFNPYSESVIIKQVNESIFVLVGATLYKVDKEAQNLTKLNLSDKVSVSLAFLKQPNQLFIRTSGNGYQYFGADSISDKALSALKIFDDIKDIHIDSENNIWVINNSDEIYQFGTTDFQNYSLPCKVYLGKIQTSNGTPLSRDGFTLTYAESSLIFSFVSPSTLKLNSTQYQYIIEGLMEDWSEWSNNNEFTVPYFPTGNYQLKFRAKNIFDEISEIGRIQFKVLPPFWETYYFYTLVLFTLVFGFYFWQKFKVKRLVKEKENLRAKVKERTEELQIKNDSITDSINYAVKIQKALLPPKEKLDTLFNDYFVYYKPKDIISGDFYLAVKRKKYTVIIAADCTGHGVPGAFMSMLGIAYINDVLSAADSSITASEILNTLRDKLITLLHQHNADSRDGMDMVVLLFDRKKNNLQYAGAHNPLYRVIPKKYKLSDTDNSLVLNENDRFYLLQYKADRFQVGNSKKSHVDFTNHVINYEEDEKFYIFSDGFVDQFGGEEERKFMYGRFRKLIINIAHISMKEQKKHFEEELKKWKKGHPQTDDILIFGMKL